VANFIEQDLSDVGSEKWQRRKNHPPSRQCWCERKLALERENLVFLLALMGRKSLVEEMKNDGIDEGFSSTCPRLFLSSPQHPTTCRTAQREERKIDKFSFKSYAKRKGGENDE
jgi:hypothetical protein